VPKKVPKSFIRLGPTLCATIKCSMQAVWGHLNSKKIRDF
jgi:hypothetical protein